jgi:ribosome maturation factor RimP
MVTDESVERLREAAATILSRVGLEIEDLTVHERGGTVEVTLVVDLPEDSTGSADLDDVADASRELSDLLDEDESLLGPGPSLLEVTTPGAERPLTAPRHFRRSRGRLLNLTRADGSTLRARLLAVGEDDVLVLRREPGVDDRGRPRKLPAGTPERLELPLDEVERARVEIEFSPPPDLDEIIGSTGGTPTADREDRSARPSSAADDSEP